MDRLPKEEVEHIALLARIELSEAESQKYAEELSAVLGYVSELQKVDTNTVDGDSSVGGQITGLNNVMAGDYVEKSEITREEFLKQAPASEKGYIKVKSVFNRD